MPGSLSIGTKQFFTVFFAALLTLPAVALTTFSVRGRVLDAVTGETLAGATAQACCTGDKPKTQVVNTYEAKRNGHLHARSRQRQPGRSAGGSQPGPEARNPGMPSSRNLGLHLGYDLPHRFCGDKLRLGVKGSILNVLNEYCTSDLPASSAATNSSLLEAFFNRGRTFTGGLSATL